MDNKVKKAHKHGHDKQQTYTIIQTRALTAKFLSARNCNCERPQISRCLTAAHHRQKKENF